MESTATARRRTPRALAVFFLAVVCLGVAGLTPSVARAICNLDTCNYGDEKPPPPPPQPVVTAIRSISPGYGWGGDLVTLTGTGFTGATVTFGGVPVTIVSATSTQIVFVVPTLPSVAGPMIETVVVSSSKGTASTTFADDVPTLDAAAGTTFGVNSQFGQGTDGSATGSVSLDRRAGGTVMQLSVTDLQWWSSLSVSVSAVFADGSGKVIAFTPPHTVTASGVLYSWPYGTSTASGTFTDSSATPTLDPATTVNVRMARVLLVRDGATELQSTLSNAVQLGQTLASVLSALGIA